MKRVFTIFLLIYFPVFMFGQVEYDSIRLSSTLPFTGVEWFFTGKSPKHYRLYYKNDHLVKIKGKLAVFSNRKAELTYVRNNVYSLINYYNRSGPVTTDSIYFYPHQFIISNSQYRAGKDIVGRYIIYGSLDNSQFECKIYAVDSSFKVSGDMKMNESIFTTYDMVYHFIMYKKADYLVKRVLKSMHTFNSGSMEVHEYYVSKRALLFYYVPLLMIR